MGCFVRGWDQPTNGLDNVAPLGNQAVKGKNKSQPVASGNTGLLDPRKTGNNLNEIKICVRKYGVAGANTLSIVCFFSLRGQ
jgi:hypothetical protein